MTPTCRAMPVWRSGWMPGTKARGWTRCGPGDSLGTTSSRFPTSSPFRWVFVARGGVLSADRMGLRRSDLQATAASASAAQHPKCIPPDPPGIDPGKEVSLLSRAANGVWVSPTVAARPRPTAGPPRLWPLSLCLGRDHPGHSLCASATVHGAGAVAPPSLHQGRAGKDARRRAALGVVAGAPLPAASGSESRCM